VSSVIQICNRALSRLGVELIASLEEETKEARLCSLWYEHARDVLLASYSWPFAKRFVELGVLDAVEPTDWTYAYTVPADMLVARMLWAGGRTPALSQRLGFEIQNNASGSGRILVTDQNDAVLIYTRKVSATGLFSPLFEDALAWLLASELAGVLKVDPTLAQSLKQNYRVAKAEAAALARREQWDVPTRSDLVTVRG
jgi:hypothetical protein